MTTPRIQASERVYLGGHVYEITGPVQRQLVSQPPQQFRMGDVDQSQHPLSSIVTWSDQRGGIGIDVMDNGAEDLSRCWFSTCSLRHKGHIVLQRLATQTASSGDDAAVAHLASAFSKIYAVQDNGIWRYDNIADSWTSVRSGLTSAPTDTITAPVNNVETLVFARSNGVEYSTDGETWSQNETDIEFLCYWREVLWGISRDGVLYFTSDLSGAWTEITTFKPTEGRVSDLFVGPDREGGEIMYAAATDGLYVYDNAAERFYKTQLAVPVHPNNGQGCLAWRNSIYFPAGLAIYRYTPGPQNLVDLVGPDRDDGLPEAYRGTIRKITATHNDLIAIISPDTTAIPAGARAFRGATAGPTAHRGAFIGTRTTSDSLSFRGAVLGWNGQGWEVKWEDASSTGAMLTTVVSQAYGAYRLWFNAGSRVYWIEVPVGITNPNRVSTTTFSSSGSWESPWFNADIINFDKTALSVHIDSQHPTSSETITLARALNYDDNNSAFTTFAVKDTSGDTEYFLPQDDDQEGLPFRAFKLRATLARGATNTNTPDMKRLGLVYRKRVEPLYGFVINVNLRSNIQGRSHREQRDDLEAVVADKKLQRFTYRDERDNEQVFWVQAVGLAFIDNTGSEPSNLAQVVLTEVH